jgi:hypothetical protein
VHPIKLEIHGSFTWGGVVKHTLMMLMFEYFGDE